MGIGKDIFITHSVDNFIIFIDNNGLQDLNPNHLNTRLKKENFLSAINILQMRAINLATYMIKCGTKSQIMSM